MPGFAQKEEKRRGWAYLVCSSLAKGEEILGTWRRAAAAAVPSPRERARGEKAEGRGEDSPGAQAVSRLAVRPQASKTDR